MSDAPRIHDDAAPNCSRSRGKPNHLINFHSVCMVCSDDEDRRVAGLDVQPDPVRTYRRSSHDKAIDEMTRRKMFGLEKYGNTLTSGNGRNSIQDAVDETADLFVYLITERSEREDLEKAYDQVVQVEADGVYERVDPDSALGNLFAVVGRYLGRQR